MFFTFALILTSFVCWRAVLPLCCRRVWKILLSLLIFLTALKFDLLRLLGGGMFSLPVLPVWLILVLTALYSALFIYFLLLLTAEIIRLPFRFRHKLKYRNQVNLALLVLAALLTAVGMWNGTKLPEVRQVEICIPELPEGFRMVLLADIHADGKLMKAGRVRQIAERVNQTAPDLILIAGDFVDGSVESCGNELLPLKDLNAKYGVFGVPGNHEYFSGYKDWMQFMTEKLNIKMLLNDCQLLPCGIAVAGITDNAALRYGLPPPDLSAAVPDDIPPAILIAHRPALKNNTGSDRKILLQVSGHTHGGMMFGFDRIVALFNGGFVSGLYRLEDGTPLYVSNGTGIWNGFPVRLGRPAEITLFVNRH